MNIGLIGRMGSGKDMVAKILAPFSQGGYHRLAFGDNIRLAVRMLRNEDIFGCASFMAKLFDKLPENFLDILTEFSAYPIEEVKDRKILQDFGTWANRWQDDVWTRPVGKVINSDPNGRFVITDFRRASEMDYFQNKNFIFIYVHADYEIRKKRLMERDGNFKEEWMNHRAEKEIPMLMRRCQFTLENNWGLDKLVNNVNYILRDAGLVNCA